jgi:serine protease Do
LVIKTRGARVTHVFPRTPADQAGLRVGDVIVRANEQPIEGDNELGRYVASQSPGGAVQLRFVREGTPRVIDLALSERPARLWEVDAAAAREVRSGYDLQSLPAELAVTLGLDPLTQGVLVHNPGVRPSSDIARYLRAEDVIVSIDGSPVANAQVAVTRLAQLPHERWSTVKVLRPGRAH